jgi:two-component system, OmpR family, KDP operon response regulator KdpE
MTDKKRVLAIDDEPGVLKFLSIGLTAAGYQVTTTSDCQAGIEIVRTNPPDIVLLDILMVPMDGFEVLGTLRTFSNVPVIVFTARSFIAAQAFKTGANDVIAKPFKPDELIKKIESVLKRCAGNSLNNQPSA